MTFHAQDEEREHLFRPDEGGQALTIKMTGRNELLPEPIRYQPLYRRASE